MSNIILKKREYEILSILADSGNFVAKVHIQMEFEKDIKNALSNLTASGCVVWKPTISREDGRNTAYKLTDLGVGILKDMESSDSKKLRVVRI